MKSLTILALLFYLPGFGTDTIYSFRFRDDVTVTVDQPTRSSVAPVVLILYALPNGNTTSQTMGKKMQPGDDWHFDIQHIRAQTRFIRAADTTHHFIVAYLENDLKSWPAWTNRYKGQHLSKKIVDTVLTVMKLRPAAIHLNSHSGGGAFLFDLMKQEGSVPPLITRLSFIDSDYRYDSSYAPILREFLNRGSNTVNVFAYNDSVALLNGKPFVSATGGTWYRTRLMLAHLQQEYKFGRIQDGLLEHFKALNGRINIFLLGNPDRGIYHTQQVERNGFIHSVLLGTPFENKGYRYWDERAYGFLIE
jgi:hypothetical protein